MKRSLACNQYLLSHVAIDWLCLSISAHNEARFTTSISGVPGHAKLAASANGATEGSVHASTLRDVQQDSLSVNNGSLSSQQNGQSSTHETLLEMVREKDEQIATLNRELMKTSNDAAVYKNEIEHLEGQVKLLQTPPRRRRWYYGWLRAT